MVDWPTLFTGMLAAGGGGAAIAFALFRWLGSKWIDARFANQLEKSRQDHATATEHLKAQISNALDRTQKLNQREFEILPEIWQKVDAAHAATTYLLSRMRSRPDFIRMKEAAFDEYISEIKIPPYRKIELKAATTSERGDIFHDTMKWLELQEATIAVNEFVNSLSRGSIYLHPDTYAKLCEYSERIGTALHHHKIDMQYPRERGDPPREEDAADAFRENGETWFRELGDYLRDRYWTEGTMIALRSDLK